MSERVETYRATVVATGREQGLAMCDAQAEQWFRLPVDDLQREGVDATPRVTDDVSGRVILFDVSATYLRNADLRPRRAFAAREG